MLVVETYLTESGEKGIGLFAKELILKGEQYWVRNENFDKLSTQVQMETFDKMQRDFIKTYGFLETTGNWYLCIDNARFSNHSDKPNTINNINSRGELISCIASKNILPGEEILCDYRDVCMTCVSDLGFENLE